MVSTSSRSDLFRHWVLGFGSGDLGESGPCRGGQPAHRPAQTCSASAGAIKEIKRAAQEKAVVAILSASLTARYLRY